MAHIKLILSNEGFPASWNIIKREKPPFEWDSKWWFILMDHDNKPMVNGPFSDDFTAYATYAKNTYADTAQDTLSL